MRAILLHFQLAYDHPFLDGNGRTARALFYWQLRTRGYWLVEYLSISRILREAPSKYAVHQLQAIERAVHEFHDYLQRKIGEVRAVERMIAAGARLNRRQLALLSDALRHPDRIYTIGAHAAAHRVTHETARSDVAALAARGLLDRIRRRQGYGFTVPRDLEQRLHGLGAAA